MATHKHNDLNNQDELLRQKRKKAENPEKAHSSGSSAHNLAQRSQQSPASLSPHDVINLQRLVGNQVTQQILQRAAWDNRMPPGTPPVKSFAEAKTKLLAEGPTTGKGKQGRKQVAEAWFKHILTNYTLSSGKVKDSYKSSHDSGAGEFSMSQTITEIPEIVIHAHMGADGKAKPNTGGSKAGAVHWKWVETEMKSESYKLDPTEYKDLLDETAGKKHWDDSQTPATPATPPSTTGTTGTTGTVGSL